MRNLFGLFGALSVFSLVACAAPSESTKHRGAAGDGAGTGDTTTPTENTGTTAAPLSCPSSVPTVKPLVAGMDANDVRIAAGKIWFRDAAGVSSIGKDGSGKATVVASTRVAHSFVDDTSIFVGEKPEADDDGNDDGIVLRAVGLDGVEIFNTTQTWNPAATKFIGSDANAFYVQTLDDNDQDAVYQVDRTKGTATEILTFGGGLEDNIYDPQIVGPNLWAVRGAKRVYKIALDDDKATPQEMFGSATQVCRLAVSTDAIYCGDGKLITRRDLTGANPAPIFDSSTDAVPVALGLPILAQGTLFTMPGADQSQTPLGGVIREMRPMPVKAEDSKVVACGRGTVVSLGADSSTIAWAEIGSTKGLYVAAR